jgi:hypothetical protein
MARTKRDLEGEIVRLSTIVDQLKGRLDGLDGGSSNGHEGDKPSTRRDLLKMAGAAVAGAAGGLLLNGVPAAAADGGNVVLGNTSGATTNDAAHTTSLTATTAAGPIPLIEVIGPNAAVPTSNAPKFYAPLQSFAAIPSGAAIGTLAEGVDGWAPGGAGAGLVGSTDVGYGVIGQSGSGLDVAAYGTGRIFQFSLVDNQGNPIAGPPTFTPAQPPDLPGGEFMRDANGVLWLGSATGTLAAAWRRINTVRLDAADGSNNFFQPVRVVDTRLNTNPGPNGIRPANSMATWGPFPGTNGIPSDAIGIVGNLTVANFNANGFAAIFPAGAAYNPNTSPSSVNITAGLAAIANSFVIGFGVGANAGKVSVYNGGTQANVIIDVTGYIQ